MRSVIADSRLEAIAGRPGFSRAGTFAEVPSGLTGPVGGASSWYAAINIKTLNASSAIPFAMIGDTLNDTSPNSYSTARVVTNADPSSGVWMLRRTGATGVVAPGTIGVGRGVLAFGLTGAGFQYVSQGSAARAVDSVPMQHASTRVAVLAAYAAYYENFMLLGYAAEHSASTRARIVRWLARRYGIGGGLTP